MGEFLLKSHRSAKSLDPHCVCEQTFMIIIENRNKLFYYKPMTNVNDDSRVVNKLEASPTDDSRVALYVYYTSHRLTRKKNTPAYFLR